MVLEEPQVSERTWIQSEMQEKRGPALRGELFPLEVKRHFKIHLPGICHLQLRQVGRKGIVEAS